MLEIQHISKYYHRQDGIVKALENVTLNIDAREFVAVQGPSGCGKTTLLLAAGGLLVPDTGEVLIDGCDPYNMSPDDRAMLRAAEIGFVFQQFYLIPYLTVLDNVRAPSIALPQENTDKRAHELISRFNLSERSSHVPSELSTGERQRTALARALLNNPKIILADEPTGNLDKDNAEIVLTSLASFVDSGGSVLLVSHDENVTSYAHRTIYLRNGKISQGRKNNNGN